MKLPLPCTGWNWVHWVQKQVEAQAEEDGFWCWSASKTMNAHCHTRGQTRHMSVLEAKPFTASTLPSSSLNGQVPEYECWVQNTRPFHFCLNKSAFLHDFSPSTFIQGLTASVWHNEAYSHLFLAHHWPNHLYHRPLQMKKPLAEKTIWENHQTTNY